MPVNNGNVQKAITVVHSVLWILLTGQEERHPTSKNTCSTNLKQQQETSEVPTHSHSSLAKFHWTYIQHSTQLLHTFAFIWRELSLLVKQRHKLPKFILSVTYSSLQMKTKTEVAVLLWWWQLTVVHRQWGRTAGSGQQETVSSLDTGSWVDCHCQDMTDWHRLS